MEQYREVDTRLDVGDSVKICIENLNPFRESDTSWLTHNMRKFNGTETIVRRVVKLGSGRAYELDGVTNWKGMPYTWMKEALVKVSGYEIASRDDTKVDDALMKATLSEYAPIEELARYMGARD